MGKDCMILQNFQLAKKKNVYKHNINRTKYDDDKFIAGNKKLIAKTRL